MIDAASVPEDLIPTAWTILSDGPVASCPNGSSAGLVNGTSNGNAAKLLHLSGKAGMAPTLKTGYTSTKNQEVVLMAISHRSQPHHGVQVRFHSQLTSNFNSYICQMFVYSACLFFSHFLSAFLIFLCFAKFLCLSIQRHTLSMAILSNYCFA